ncbi:MAG: biotin-dependent carboxyltransferase family protein [Paracoccaceae bacterium]
MTAVLEILRAGPHVTLQDAGRPGLMRFGVPASGPMDRKALAIANAALGNPPGATGIEVSPGGLALACRKGPVSLALAGGGFIGSHNDLPVGSWSVLTLHPGDRLTLRPGPWGSWCCIAVAGQIQSRTWLNSASTHAPSGFGGGVLAQGQTLQVTDPRRHADATIPCPVWARPRQRLHVTLGPQDHLFAPDTLALFLAAPFRLTPAFDRMGLRLAGPGIAPQGALGIPSQGITRGAVQVAGDGVATVLLADHQTTGGYPKIATVLSDDTDGLAQLRPGDALRFIAITPEQAITLARQRALATRRWLAALSSRAKALP